jgi:Gram-negative bacterial TonB protein C-terminal
MKKERKKEQFIQQPVYVGGDKAMTAFIYQHLRIPVLALQNNVEGIVFLEFGIDFKGNVIETRVIKGLGFGCNEEAERVVKLLKFDMGKYPGMKIIFHKKAKIQFKKAPLPVAAVPDLPSLPAPLEGEQNFSFQYVITPSVAVVEEQSKPVETVYSYNITF